MVRGVGVGMGMVASPSSSLNTPVGGGVASPGGEEAVYREKVRQLSKYIEPLRRMIQRMVNEGESEFRSLPFAPTHSHPIPSTPFHFHPPTLAPPLTTD